MEPRNGSVYRIRDLNLKVPSHPFLHHPLRNFRMVHLHQDSMPCYTRSGKPWKSRKEDLTEYRVDHSTEAPTVSMEFHSLITLITSPIDVQTALQKLQSLSLIERRSDDGTPSLWMHDLIEFMMLQGRKKHTGIGSSHQCRLSAAHLA